jgi:drug/metabolite transporter (DMT)-like permease
MDWQRGSLTLPLFGERHSPATFAAVGVVLLGVALVNRRPAAG